MINQIYQLVSPRQIEISYKDESLAQDKIVVRPKYLSICNASRKILHWHAW